MGLFKNMKGAMDMAAEAHQQYEKPGRFGTVGFDMDRAVGDRDSLQGQAQELNRILTVGQPGDALIRGHIDAGEQVAGNPVWIFDLEVTPDGGAPYAVQHREIVSTMAMGSYPDGTSMACRIDPADPQKVAFGEKPFLSPPTAQ
jgi:hypothetical protein